MTDHEHEWFTLSNSGSGLLPYHFFQCRKCPERLMFPDALAMLNEHAKLKRLDVEMMTTDDDGNPVECGMDLLDWQAHLQTELGLSRLENVKHEAELVVLAKDIEILRKANGNFAQTNFELKEENERLTCKLVEAEHSLRHALSAINDALKEVDDETE